MHYQQITFYVHTTHHTLSHTCTYYMSQTLPYMYILHVTYTHIHVHTTYHTHLHTCTCTYHMSHTLTYMYMYILHIIHTLTYMYMYILHITHTLTYMYMYILHITHTPIHVHTTHHTHSHTCTCTYYIITNLDYNNSFLYNIRNFCLNQFNQCRDTSLSSRLVKINKNGFKQWNKILTHFHFDCTASNGSYRLTNKVNIHFSRVSNYNMCIIILSKRRPLKPWYSPINSAILKGRQWNLETSFPYITHFIGFLYKMAELQEFKDNHCLFKIFTYTCTYMYIHVHTCTYMCTYMCTYTN